MSPRLRGLLPGGLLLAGFLLAGFLLAGQLLVGGAAIAQQYAWVNQAPGPLKGIWVERGQRCEDENSRLIIFSDGGYRWRKTRTEWGFARGKYAYEKFSPTTYFRVQRFVQQEAPDFQISTSGTELRKYSYGSGKVITYDKCPD